MTKRIGKLQLNKETMRCLSGAPPATFERAASQGICPSLSYCVACISVGTSCQTAC